MTEGLNALLGGIVLTCAAATAGAAPPDAARAQFENHARGAKSDAGVRLGGHLKSLARNPRASSTRAFTDQTPSRPSRMPGLTVRDEYVAVSAYADGDPEALRTELVAKGMVNAAVHGKAVSGRVPLQALGDMSATPSLRFMRPSMAITQAGLTTTQGDRAQRSDRARQNFAVSGKGVRVGVLSDSYNCLPGPLQPGNPYTTAAQDIRNNDLPRDVRVLKDLSTTPSSDCSDEGRAMMQLIHDAAPGASLAFYTAFESAEDFAAGIVRLADAGAKVIVDDVIYFAEPMFLDGPIAQAADAVKARGVAYFSAAGNQARQSYEAPFRTSSVAGLSGGAAHDFRADAVVDTRQRITARAGSATLLSFQWDQPWYSVNGKGSASDLDIYFVNDAGKPIPLCDDNPNAALCQYPGTDGNVGGDAVELPILLNFTAGDVRANIVIERYAGPAPGRMKYVYFDLDVGVASIDEHNTRSGTLYGHANAAGAEAVGAAAWYNTSLYGPLKAGCTPACLEPFSSAGGVPILFNKLGNRLSFPLVRIKPGFTAPDGGNTSFFSIDIPATPGLNEPDGFPNFFGTSAAAPHAAAIAALMLEQRARDIAAGKSFSGGAQLRPDALYIALRRSAETQDIRLRAGRTTTPVAINDDGGFDYDSGFGFVNALKALQLTAGY